MKKTIRIDINYPDCDSLNITAADLMVIQNEVLNQCGIVEEVMEGRFEIDAELIEPISEEELDEMANKYLQAKVLYRIDESEQFFINLIGAAYKAGYRKALEYLMNEEK